MMPWSGGVGGGKLTVIKAGPGFHEEKNYDIGADGHITEVKPVSMINDARKLQKTKIADNFPMISWNSLKFTIIKH